MKPKLLRTLLAVSLAATLVSPCGAARKVKIDNPDFLNLTLARWKDKRPALQRFINASIATFARRLELPQQQTSSSELPAISAPRRRRRPGPPWTSQAFSIDAS